MKAPCDGEIGLVKRTALAAAKTTQAIVGNAQYIYTYTKYILAIPRQDEYT